MRIIHIFTDIIFCIIYKGFTQHFQLNILLKRDYFLGDWVVPDAKSKCQVNLVQMIHPVDGNGVKASLGKLGLLCSIPR